MENHIEANFRAIQKILDSCVAHDYKTKVDALFLKREYLTKAQIKDYLRQEILAQRKFLVGIPTNKYLCLPLYYETRTTSSSHPSRCAYRQL